MKYICALILSLSFAHAEEKPSTKEKVKQGVNKAADKIDAGTREVIDQSKKAWKKHRNK